MPTTCQDVDRRDASEQVAVERAIAELRAGRPVAVLGARPALVACAETVDAALAAFLSGLDAPVHLVLPAPRLRRLGLPERAGAGIVHLTAVEPERIARLALRVDARIDAPVAPATPFDESALDLARAALMLPAVVVVPLADAAAVPAHLLTLDEAAIAAYRGVGVRIVSRAPVPLEGALDSEFVVFRGGDGLRDQVAIVVGRPDLSAPVAVRLHSACLTGDLFGSLKCDCGDQLRGTIHRMSETGGGILLYLDQEGRGNGLANKIRAYDLQACGFDTYEADEALGYGVDQRRYDFAAAMLRGLGVNRVQVVSNNPAKIAALAAAGLDVVGSQRSLGRVTAQNLTYLTVKRDRTGHALGRDIAERLEATVT
ncbi:GTP cyclohydrolase [Methylobacterium sp. Leaf399]|uniref:GTP cyclohydrolase II RibA n=1 Tax=unclassified Methylobacterium TaxID=2615210 RepID=UPI0006FB61AB|nr:MULTISPECIES: GTP cyclohydrolase II RibA [unclassified Methylobacterium]KQT19807.1 GTP cyclohydrolase [Methylobacterium sp. Leaf399]KQT83780.1 GTP cyclohydrolase [Methylobacterium sp. Leaf466]